jgi:hypothetical protein
MQCTSSGATAGFGGVGGGVVDRLRSLHFDVIEVVALRANDPEVGYNHWRKLTR